MHIDESLIIQLQENFKKANNIAVIGHKNPDGDALGSVLSLYEYLSSIDKNITPHSVGPFQKQFSFMPHISEFKTEFNPDAYDLIIFCDCGAPEMTDMHQSYPSLFDKHPKVVNIDHHPSNNYFGELNIIDTKAPSTTYMLYQVFSYLKIPITKTIANNLLTGIISDTGGFMHTNTTPNTYRVASELIKAGGSIETINNNFFRNKNISKLKLWGRVFERVNINKEGIALAAITKQDFNECDSEYHELSGAIDYLNSIPEAKYTMLLTEKDNLVKGSLRTQKDLDLDKVATNFGGGGHQKAAGFQIKGHLVSETHWKIIAS